MDVQKITLFHNEVVTLLVEVGPCLWKIERMNVSNGHLTLRTAMFRMFLFIHFTVVDEKIIKIGALTIGIDRLIGIYINVRLAR